MGDFSYYITNPDLDENYDPQLTPAKAPKRKRVDRKKSFAPTRRAIAPLHGGRGEDGDSSLDLSYEVMEGTGLTPLPPKRVARRTNPPKSSVIGSEAIKAAPKTQNSTALTMKKTPLEPQDTGAKGKIAAQVPAKKAVVNAKATGKVVAGAAPTKAQRRTVAAVKDNSKEVIENVHNILKQVVKEEKSRLDEKAKKAKPANKRGRPAAAAKEEHDAIVAVNAACDRFLEKALRVPVPLVDRREWERQQRTLKRKRTKTKKKLERKVRVLESEVARATREREEWAELRRKYRKVESGERDTSVQGGASTNDTVGKGKEKEPAQQGKEKEKGNESEQQEGVTQTQQEPAAGPILSEEDRRFLALLEPTPVNLKNLREYLCLQVDMLELLLADAHAFDVTVDDVMAQAAARQRDALLEAAGGTPAALLIKKILGAEDADKLSVSTADVSEEEGVGGGGSAPATPLKERTTVTPKGTPAGGNTPSSNNRDTPAGTPRGNNTSNTPSTTYTPSRVAAGGGTPAGTPRATPKRSGGWAAQQAQQQGEEEEEVTVD